MIPTLLFLLLVGVAEGAFLIWLGLSMKATVLGHLEEILALTTATKEYARSADTHNKIAARLVQETRTAAQAAPEIVQEVKQVPEKTADRVMERIKDQEAKP